MDGLMLTETCLFQITGKNTTVIGEVTAQEEAVLMRIILSDSVLSQVLMTSMTSTTIRGLRHSQNQHLSAVLVL